RSSASRGAGRRRCRRRGDARGQGSRSGRGGPGRTDRRRRDHPPGLSRPAGRPPRAASGARPARRDRLSKDAYRRQRAALDTELSRLGLRKSHLELAMGDPAVSANFVEMGRVTSELADVEAALAVAEDAWLELEERAP